MEKLTNFINGKFAPPNSDQYLDIFEPATGQVYAQVSDSNSDDVENDISDDSKEKREENENENDEEKSSCSENSDEESDEEGKGGSEEGDDEAESEGGASSGEEGGMDGKFEPESKTDRNFRNNETELVSEEAKPYRYINLPNKADLKKIIIDYSELYEKNYKKHYSGCDPGKYSNSSGDEMMASATELFKDFRKNNKKVVEYLAKEFEMKKAAKEHARAATANSGILDSERLYTYKYNEHIFKKLTITPDGKNHGLVMFVDWSGSMSRNMKGTIEQMMILVMFCKRVNIPFEVYAFSDSYTRYNDEAKNDWIDSNGYMLGEGMRDYGTVALTRFNLLNLFSSRMRAKELHEAYIFMAATATHYSNAYRYYGEGVYFSIPDRMALGGTPLNDAIIAMMELVPKFKKETGVQKVNTIFLTDGASHGLPGVYDYKFNKEENTHTEVITRLRNYHKSKIILTDPVMNKTYEIKNITNDLLRILKNRVPEMNVVGFFIAGTGRGGKVNKRTLYYLLPKDSQWMIMEKIKFLNKNNYLALDQLGYDEYYVLPGGNALKVENETLDDELIGASKAKLKSAFGKMSKGKVSSRQLLNKFVKMVA